MATGLEHVHNTPQTAIGKVKVGEPPKHLPGNKGVTIWLALFYDGTLNNRTNTNKRLSKPGILDGKDKDERSSYANFLSNVAIMEYMNLRQKPENYHISVYVEGIGTINFEEGATTKDKNGKEAKVSDADNGNDEMQGYAFGSGPTGIRDRVTKGINQARKVIRSGAYDPETEFVEKIIIDVVGFSRGAAAARHFVSRRNELPGPLVNQGPPELIINFIGLFDTVSSFDEGGKDWVGITGNVLQKVTEGLFDDDVRQLHLNMGNVPKRVVHLTAGDEYRNSFSLTTIDTSLKAGVGFELELPGVHSDIGGAYAEPDPANPTMDPHKPIRSLNKEVRRIKSGAEKRQLIAQGWYTDGSAPGTPNQFVPWMGNIPAIRSYELTFRGRTYRSPATSSYAWAGDNGVRYLTNEYQYIPLFIMLDFAQNGAGYPGGTHRAMKMESLAMAKNTRYRVPPKLLPFRDSFLKQAKALTGSQRHEQIDLLKKPAPPPPLRWLRNHYLHRSARSATEGKAYIGMESAANNTRVIIHDDKPVGKLSTPAKEYILDKTDAVGQGLEAAKKKMRDLWNTYSW